MKFHLIILGIEDCLLYTLRSDHFRTRCSSKRASVCIFVRQSDVCFSYGVVCVFKTVGRPQPTDKIWKQWPAPPLKGPINFWQTLKACLKMKLIYKIFDFPEIKFVKMNIFGQKCPKYSFLAHTKMVEKTYWFNFL